MNALKGSFYGWNEFFDEKILLMHISKILLIAVIALTSLPVLSQDKSRSTIIEDSLHSTLLKMNRKYTVYLPADYHQSVHKNYPVLYLLHGHSHRNNTFVEDGNLRHIADSLIATGAASEMIIVTPDANRVKNGYFDTKDWPYEQFFFEEFMPHIETTIRIRREASSRAIGGFSMGGGGAVAYTLKHPGMFGAIYAMSALMTLPQPKERSASPNPHPQYMEFGQSVLANDCIVLLEHVDQQSLKQLRKIKWFVDCGDDDFLLDVNTKFCRAMKQANIPFELRVRDGDHNFKYWTTCLYLALPFVSEVFR